MASWQQAFKRKLFGEKGRKYGKLRQSSESNLIKTKMYEILLRLSKTFLQLAGKFC